MSLCVHVNGEYYGRLAQLYIYGYINVYNCNCIYTDVLDSYSDITDICKSALEITPVPWLIFSTRAFENAFSAKKLHSQ